MNAKTCKRLRAAFPGNPGAYKSAKKLEAKRLAQLRSGQKPKLAEPRTGAVKHPQPRAGSAWKRTGPLIVSGPFKRTHKDHRYDGVWDDYLCATEQRRCYGALPKCELDALALRYPVEVA